MTDVDFIVIGGGTAGCIVAGRLAARFRVILLESGVRSRNPWSHLPLGYPKLVDNPAVNWCYQTEPEPFLNGRRLKQPRGKLLGGSAAINGMCYARGFASDFDYWRQLGNVGWSFEDVLPFFKLHEDNERGEDDFHGVGGPIHVANQTDHRKIGDAFIEAAVQLGHRRNKDFNGAQEDGFGYFQWMYKNGRRVQIANVYLKTKEAKANLQIITKATVSRIVVEGRRATGVEYLKDGQLHKVSARREVIVCAGAFNSPQILQLSGIGPAEHVSRFNIPIVADLPGVGLNYKDHFTLQMHHESTISETINKSYGSLSGRIIMGLSYAFGRRGYLAHVGIYSGGFIRTTEAASSPDVEIMCTLWTRRAASKVIDSFSGFSLLPIILRPAASGTVMVASSDPSAPPAIQTNFFGDSGDIDIMVRAVKATRKIVDASPLRELVKQELGPGRTISSDADITDYLRDNIYSGFHPVGTCKMGQDKNAVVDARLRVHGVAGLRVVDASIMPMINSGHTMAPTMMIGEKGARMIIEDSLAAPKSEQV